MFARLTLFAALAILLAACTQAVTGFEDCPITRLPDDPQAIGPLYGDEDGLQVFLINDGVWRQLPPGENGGYFQKVFWKYPGYVALYDQTPDLTVTGRQLDGNGTFMNAGPATNATAPDLYGDAILAGVEIPHTCCWELTGEYQGSSLSFVVWVGD